MKPSKIVWVIVVVVFAVLIPALYGTGLLKSFESKDKFQDMAVVVSDICGNMVNVPPGVGALSGSVTVEQLDPTRDYLCRSLRGSNAPCPEGTFCDGVRQVCETRYIDQGIDNVVGYYS